MRGSHAMYKQYEDVYQKQ